MSAGNLASGLFFSHRGHLYTVNLQERPGKCWAWSYVLHDIEHPEQVQITGRATRLHPRSQRGQNILHAAGGVEGRLTHPKRDSSYQP